VPVARSVAPSRAADTLRITEIFYSLQGEARTVGCPRSSCASPAARCAVCYCDTAYAFHGGELQTLAEIGEAVAAYAPAYVTVTGGEPLAQPNCLPLLSCSVTRATRCPWRPAAPCPWAMSTRVWSRCWT
jgi:7-carboxy-7-deazaguanine synthase